VSEWVSGWVSGEVREGVKGKGTHSRIGGRKCCRSR
jgi:hypothetical protein